MGVTSQLQTKGDPFNCRTLPLPLPAERIAELDLQTDRTSILRQLNLAAELGDVTTIRHIFTTFPQLDIDVASTKGCNSTLHKVLMHNGEIIAVDYLIENGANVNLANKRGDTPLTLAIQHFRGPGRRHGCRQIVEKLIAAGATWDVKFDSGPYVGMTPLDVAVKYDNAAAVSVLNALIDKTICQEVNEATRKGWSVCPTCNLLVRFPHAMSRLERDQASTEQHVQKNGVVRKRGERIKYTSRKYLDQLLTHSNGQA